MPANSYAQGEYGQSLAIPVKHGNAMLVYAVATFASGVPVTDATLSAPGCSITGAAGQYFLSHPNCAVFIPLGDPSCLVADQVAASAVAAWEALSPSTGLEGFETAARNAFGTASVPPDGTTIYAAGLAVQLR